MSYKVVNINLRHVFCLHSTQIELSGGDENRRGLIFDHFIGLNVIQVVSRCVDGGDTFLTKTLNNKLLDCQTMIGVQLSNIYFIGYLK